MLIRRAGTVGGWTLISRVFGFGRDLMMAAILGASPLADAFMIAFRLPNHFRAILAEGAFNSAFIPTYAEMLERDGEAPAKAFRSGMLSWVLAANLVVLLLALVATGWLVAALAPGISGDAEQQALVIDLTRITFPYLACIAIVSLLSGVLNAHDRFAAAAAAPILLNIAMMATLGLAWLFPSAAHAAAWGVLAGGLAQLAYLTVASLSAGLSFRLVRPPMDTGFRSFIRRFGPALLGAGGVQIAMFADTIIATFLPTGSLSYLYYADRLYQLPLAVIGIAIGTALLPDLARRVAGADLDSARDTLGYAVTLGMMLGFPFTVGFVMLGEFTLQALFGRGAFGPEAVAGSAAALAAYSIGLPAAIALRALITGFHARGDTMTPVKALGIATIVNVALKLVLVTPFQHAGLAAATAAGVWVYAGILALLLARRRQIRLSPANRRRLVATAIAVVAMALTIALTQARLGLWIVGAAPFAGTLFALLTIGAVAMLAYALPLAAAEWVNRRRAGSRAG